MDFYRCFGYRMLFLLKKMKKGVDAVGKDV